MFYQRKNIALSEKSKLIYDSLIDPNSDLCRIKKEFDFSFIYDEIKNNYCLDDGRNSIDGVIALRAIFIQKYFGLRERQLERKAMFDIEIKHFLDIEIDSKAFDFTTIWKFKKMLGEEKVESIFNHILEQIKSKGIIKSFRRQAIDTIPILAAASLPSITCLIYQAIKGVCNSVSNEILDKIFTETELTQESSINIPRLDHYLDLKTMRKLRHFKRQQKEVFKC